MALRSNSSNPLGCLVGFIGLIASVIGIYAFVTGYDNLTDAMNSSSDTESAGQEESTGFSPLSWLVSPTPVPAIDPETLPSYFFPSREDVHEEWLVVNDEHSSNEIAARDFDDPSEQLLLFDSWGRVGGQTITYEHKDGCNYKSGEPFVIFTVTLYQTDEGVQKAFDWFAQYVQETATSYEWSYDIGDRTFISWSDTQNGCDPPVDLRQVSVRFRKHNVNVVVIVASIKDTMLDSDVLESAVVFAEIIELNITAASIER